MSNRAASKRAVTQPAAARPKPGSEPAHTSAGSLGLNGPRLQIDSEVARCIRQHARSHMKTEVCGVLIGEISNGIVEVQTSIEAVNATQAGTHVTFTQDAWESIYKIKDERYPDERIVGWYHSHPGFGVFLSEHDTFIHRNFFSSPDQVAWVYDPHTDEEGCFGWIDGDIHRVPTFSIVDQSGDGIERTPKHSDASQPDPDEEFSPTGRGDRTDWTNPTNSTSAPPAWLRWTISGVSYIAALAVGFLVAYFLFPHFVPIPVDPLTGEPLFQTRPSQPQPGTTAPQSPSSPSQSQPETGSPSNPAPAPAPKSAPNAAPNPAQPATPPPATPKPINIPGGKK